MSLSRFLFWLSRALLLPCIIGTSWLYLYPFFRGCAFPEPPDTAADCHVGDCSSVSSYAAVAPFRLLAFGDPQLEGDTSLPDRNGRAFPAAGRVLQERDGSIVEDLDVTLRAIRALATDDLPRILQAYRKRLDLLGNDYYLAHIYRTLHWYTQPTHVAVLGDLLGSQWISDAEFDRRSDRFWNRVFRGGARVPDEVAAGSQTEALGHDKAWKSRIINMAGNHDIGYSGDLDESRIERFERAFGPVNWDITFTLPSNESLPAEQPSEHLTELRLVVLNSMNLDGPVLSPSLQSDTYDYINNLISSSRPVEDRTHFTLLLTHIPLHKEEGVCIDPPFFSHFPVYQGGGVKEQNHLSPSASKGILEGLFGMSGREDAPARGMGRNGLVLTGHDHEGCDVLHYHLRNETESWRAVRWEEARSSGLAERNLPGVREVTVRSMMGDFGGNAALVSVWWDQGVGEWRSAVEMCGLGVQHWWWAVHVVDLVEVLLVMTAVLVRLVEKRWSGTRAKAQKKRKVPQRYRKSRERPVKKE
ncbi:hypothetical protein W97_06508 [Coniosporium apollinis CBS 100218]|uniref:Calcineurin-like phosphoesterase domain-containing protein n=1 Tax=Coniosporium apollinis (strain CBS 100218) TaxID=1168221 RepID=R7YZ71_CONA1|nr:uncharacterized protein W97_06508 [Coniosporium apollinis CBS 100218]EON67255.1 hypothetical protein W97_06508 [Coniosporium apollinis CBS 100218]